MGKSFTVPTYRLVEVAGAHAEEPCQVGIEHHPAATHDVNAVLDLWGRNQGRFAHPTICALASGAANLLEYQIFRGAGGMRSGRAMEHGNDSH